MSKQEVEPAVDPVDPTDTRTETLVRNAPGPSLAHTASTTNPIDPTAPPTTHPEAHPTAPISKDYKPE